MSSKILISALATVGAIVVVAAPQDPSFEYPALKHAGFDQPKINLTYSGQATSDKVSVTFKNATIREVLDWLKSEGVSFVVADGLVDKDARINVNIVNEPVEAVLNAIGTTLGGHWEKRNDIWVFQKGRDFFGGETFVQGEKGSDPFTTVKGGDFTAFQDDRSANRAFTLPGKMTKEQQDALQKAMKSGDDPKAWQEFAKAWQKWAQEYEKNYRDFEKNFKGQDFNFTFDPTQLEEFQKGGIEFTKPGDPFRIVQGGKDFKPLDEKQILEIERQAKDMAKAGQEMRIKLGDGQMRGYTIEGDEIRALDEKELKAMQKRAEEMAKAGQEMRIKLDDGQMRTFRQLDKKQIEEMEKRAQEMAKVGQEMRIKLGDGQMKGYTIEGGKVRELNQKELQAMEKRARDMAKRSMELDSKNGVLRGYTMDGNKVRALDAKQMKELQQHMRDLQKTYNGRVYVGSGPKVSVSTSGHNLKAIYDLMTPSQEQKLKRLGYINYSDLNAKQRALLGVITDETWTISYKTDKANLTIKSDR